ncbi:MAG: DUF4347 domain-containing protein [Deltaproteobacteria bacterium]|nr:DUF4347 domain-containing protein [Deltaproteobacteria bacterium]
MKQGPKSRRWLRPLIEELERRLLLSADVESVLLDPSLGQPEGPRDPAAELELLQDDSAAGEIASVARRELLFVDSGVAGHEQLVKDLSSGGPEGRSLEVVLLDSGRDGVEQITEALARSQDLDAIHIVSHGSQGAVQLGNVSLSAGTLDAHADALASWGNAFVSEADILFYGCDLAGGESGAAFVDSLAELTGTDVAASINLTGSALLGGDWDLEHHQGSIETAVAFGGLRDYSGTLALPTADAGGPYAINEGDSVALDGSASSDPDGDPLTWSWDLNNDGTFGDVTGETPNVPWATLQSYGIDDDGAYTIGLRVDDGVSGTDTATTTLTVANTAPTLTTTGAAQVKSGSTYTLNLGASDPGNDSISSWTINWGDGSIETIAGNPGSVTHTYSVAGLTRNILAAATDEDGTFLQNELLVVSGDNGNNNSIFRYENTTGTFLQQFATSDGLDYPIGIVIGPDGNIYVSGWKSDNVLRYDAQSGAFIDEFVTAGSGGLNRTGGLAFGPDGNLYVSTYSNPDGDVLRFDGATGAFIDVFVSGGGSGVIGPEGLAWGPDGNLYVADWNTSSVFRYDGTTGAQIDLFVSAGSGGLVAPEDLVFGPDGDLYVASSGTDSVLRYSAADGSFIDEFVAAGSGGINYPAGITFGPDGNLYVSGFYSENVLRYDGTTGAFIDEYVAAGSGGITKAYYLTFIPQQQVSVTAPNQAPVVNDQSFSVDENSADTTVVGTVAASDPDAGDTLSYSITAGNTGGAFAINSSTGQITVASSAALDYETTPSFGLTVQVQDDDTPSLSDTATVTVNLNDVNDAPSFTYQDDFEGDTLGVTPSGWSVKPGASNVVVADDGGNQVLSDGDGAGFPSSDGSVVSGNPAWGDVVVSQDFRSLDGNVDYSGLLVRYVDADNMVYGGIASSTTVDLSNKVGGTWTTLGSWTIPDVGTTWHSQELRVFGDTVEIYVDGSLIGSATLSPGAPSAGQAGFWAQNAGNEGYRDNHIVRPYGTSVSDGLALDENSAFGTSVATVIATDPDVGDNLTYSITAGNTGGAFGINSSTGEITVATPAAVNFETTPTFNLTVQATDDGTPSLSDTATVTVNLNDLDEAPVINDATFAVDENAANGTAVGSVPVAEPDANDTYTYSITAGDPTSAFAIDNSGNLTPERLHADRRGDGRRRQQRHRHRDREPQRPGRGAGHRRCDLRRRRERGERHGRGQRAGRRARCQRHLHLRDHGRRPGRSLRHRQRRQRDGRRRLPAQLRGPERLHPDRAGDGR